LEYHKRYYEDNKEVFREQSKQYRESNREVVKARKQKYYSDPENRRKKAEKNKEWYCKKANEVKARQLARRRERKIFIDGICLRYGCQNPGCKWEGQFEPYQLTFHHVDPSQKEIEVAKMHSWSYEKIVAEINKCIVLCRNCHPLADRGLIVITENMMCQEAK
jgi:hypothetical protein